jgi:hypothetical protein
MTEWKMRTVRHIPEDELHAYLDQALSRSQCVEIERHLAECTPCQGRRDDIAALRDRTTSLLARVGPPTIVAPPYAVLRARHAERRDQRTRRIANGAWAASVIGAALLGWGMNRLQPEAQVAVAAPPRPTASVVPAQATSGAPVQTAVHRPRVTPANPEPRLVRIRRDAAESSSSWGFAHAEETDPASISQVRSPDPVSLSPVSYEVPDFSAQPVSVAPELAGLWRTVVPDSVGGIRGGDIPLVSGLSVVQMRVQPGHGEGDVTAVDQTLESGELIRTIAGPAGRVGALVEQNSELDPQTNAAGSRVTVTIRQGDRMVAVTGPSEALGSLLSRVNRRRY